MYLLNYVHPCFLKLYTVNRFGELIRKIWNPRNFKAHVSPHEMLQVGKYIPVSTLQVLLSEQAEIQ